MKSCFKKLFVFCAVVALTASFSLFANGGIPWENIEGGPQKITLTNDKDLHLIKEDLEIRFEADTVLVTCEYLLENVSNEKKDIDFAFNIPLSSGSWSNTYIQLYKIYDNGKAIHASSKTEIIEEGPYYTEEVIWRLSKLSFDKKETKNLKIVYKVMTNTDGKFCTANAGENSFKYNLFPAASFGNGVIDEFNLTIDKTNVVLYEGKITSISGIQLENDNTQFIQNYSFKNFDLHQNKEIVINYDIRGYYVGKYIRDGFTRRISGINATTELCEGNVVYYSKNMSDKDYSTAWAEGAQDSGKNQIIHVFLSDDIAHGRPPFVAHTVTHLYLLNGFRRDEKTYYENNRVKKIKLTLWMDNTKKSFEITLPDRPYAEVNDYNIAYEADLLNTYLPLGRLGTIYDANWFDIEILEVYPGTKYNDTCISEIVILNVPQPYN